MALVAGGEEVPVVSAASSEGKPVAVIVRETPFYGEQGGQVGDMGAIRAPLGLLRVADTRRPVSTAV